MIPLPLFNISVHSSEINRSGPALFEWHNDPSVQVAIKAVQQKQNAIPGTADIWTPRERK
jgi:hypothetical protein